MRRTHSFILAVLLTGIAVGLLVAPRQSRADDLPSPLAPGTFTLTIKSGGYDRLAHVHIPTGYKTGTKPVLVLALHGAGGEGTGMLTHDGWAAKSDKEGFLVVAPDGLPARPTAEANFLTNPHLWNSGQLRAGSPRAAIDDVAFIRALLDALKERVPYDEAHVFCAGHSNGGGMAFRLGAELPERLTAIGSVAGLMSVKNPQPKRPLPTLFIVGTKDLLVPLAGGEVKLPWGTKQNPPIAETLAAWAKALGCEPEPKTLSDVGGLKTLEYPSKSGGPTLTAIYIDGQGHNWPGGTQTLPESMVGPVTTKLNATDALWDFFKRQK